MPRLKVPEPKQQGSRTGSWKAPALKKKRRRCPETPSTPAWKHRASRSKAAGAAGVAPATATPVKLSPSSQAEIALKHAQLSGLASREKSAALTALCTEYGVGRQYPAAISISQSISSVDSRLPKAKLRPYDLDEFYQLIEEVHEDYPEEKLDALFDSKMRVIKAILACEPPGGNAICIQDASCARVPVDV